MRRSVKGPLVVGSLMLIGTASLVAFYSPMPGPLARPHGQVRSLSMFWGCESCHAEAGLGAGCLGCHEEIQGQLDADAGLHAKLVSADEPVCETCHGEHNGEGFALVNAVSWEGKDPRTFDHGHVAFSLEGRHDELSCEGCHATAEPVSFVPTYPDLRRETTFLGLDQACDGCHTDVHEGGLDASAGPEGRTGCETCHDQESFRRATRFDHDRHLVLAGAHDRVSCEGCHGLPRPPVVPAATGDGRMRPSLPFHIVTGKTCADCHASPHRAPWANEAASCEKCHPTELATFAEATRSVTPDVHAEAGFPLVAPHDRVDCAKCHDPFASFAERYADPAAPGYARAPETCEGCHDDVHGGQLAERHPSPVGPGSPGVPSDLAEGAGRDSGRVGWGRGTRCRDCHEGLRFLPARYGMAEHARVWPLVGAHPAVPCRACHEEDEVTGGRKLTGLARDCQGCHESPHRASFGEPCATCHLPEALRWDEADALVTADRHAKTGFRLMAPHAKVTCGGCHDPALATFDARYPDPAAPGYARAEGTCEGCHADVHDGRFQAAHPSTVASGKTRCLGCHEPTRFAPSRYGVADHTTFALTGKHATTECGACHPKDPDTGVPALAGVPRACGGCHDDVHGGQFSIASAAGAGGRSKRRVAAGDCTDCHRDASDTWRIDPFDHAAKTDYPLVDAHAKAACADCHEEERRTVTTATGRRVRADVRVYRGTEQACDACHVDVHVGQFRDGVGPASDRVKTRCERCHESFAKWDAGRFDHDRDSRFALEGEHEQVGCLECHPKVRTPRGREVVQYRPLRSECRDCHGFDNPR